MTADLTRKHIDQIFRQSYGRIAASLMAQFGMEKMDQVENAVMESFYQALRLWPLNGLPENPRGWLYTAGRNRMIDVQRKERRRYGYPLQPDINPGQGVDHNGEIADPELRLLFVICHPELRPVDQLTFMLKVLSGFGIREIGNALLISEAAVKKRLSRGRAFVKSRKLSFSWPPPQALPDRRQMVHTALYLLFNEGYYSSHPDRWVSREFCLEAMRFCKFLSEHPLADHDTFALLALMCYHISRFESRTDASNGLVLLKDQDRSLWNKDMIRLGHHYLEKSASMTDEKTPYQLEAFISAQHCLADSIETTNWEVLDLMYTHLHKLKPNDLVLLNLIIVKVQAGKLQEAKTLFEQFEPDDMVKYKSTYYLVGAQLYSRISDDYTAKMWISKALENAKNKRESDFLAYHLLNRDQS